LGFSLLPSAIQINLYLRVTLRVPADALDETRRRHRSRTHHLSFT
jgi:hypothetical protein